MLSVATAGPPGPNATRLSAVDPTGPNLRGGPPRGSPTEQPPHESETAPSDSHAEDTRPTRPTHK
eukprot:3321161-Pyramimonas_sp.AAC.1